MCCAWQLASQGSKTATSFFMVRLPICRGGAVESLFTSSVSEKVKAAITLWRAYRRRAIGLWAVGEPHLRRVAVMLATPLSVRPVALRPFLSKGVPLQMFQLG